MTLITIDRMVRALAAHGNITPEEVVAKLDALEDAEHFLDLICTMPDFKRELDTQKQLEQSTPVMYGDAATEWRFFK